MQTKPSPLLRHAAKLDDARTEEALLGMLTEALDEVGIEFWIYITVAADGGRPIILANIDVHDDVAEAFDPFLEYCCNTYEATHTGIEFMDDYPYLDRRSQDFIRNAGRMGFRSGLGIPVRTANSPVYGGFNLGTGYDRERFLSEIVPLTDALRSFCLLAHMRIEAMAAEAASDADKASEREANADMLRELTQRELDILAVLAGGASRRECARHFGISEHTVAAHTRNLYDKLGVHNRVGAAAIAIAAGLVPTTAS